MKLPAVVSRLPMRVRNGITVLFALGMAHIALSLQALPVIGVLAIVYLIFPPMGLYGMWEVATQAPLFALMVYGGSATIIGLLLSAIRALCVRLPRPLRWTLAASLSLWTLVATGEGIRTALMDTQLADSAPACHRTWSLIASLRQRYVIGFDEFDAVRHPHAWRVRGDTVSTWSYRTLRFEPAPAWSGSGDAIAQCHGDAVSR